MRTAEALKPRSALAASGKSRTVGEARSTYSGKRSARDSWRASQSPIRSPSSGSTATGSSGGRSGNTGTSAAAPGLAGAGLLRRRQREYVDAAGLAQNRRIAQKFAGLAEQPGAHAGRADQPGKELARRVGVQAVDRGLAARHLADTRRHHLALHGERGELGVDQLFLVVAEIDRAQGQQRNRHDIEQQDAARERRMASRGATPAAQQRGRSARPRRRRCGAAAAERRGDPRTQAVQSEPVPAGL